MRSKFSPAEALELLALYNTGEYTYWDLAIKYRCSDATINETLRRARRGFKTSLCELCKTEFIISNANKKYCSRACTVRANRLMYWTKYKENNRQYQLKYKYGITPEEYAALLAKQKGGCNICGAPPPEGQSLHVDHNHKTGLVRGLLCFRCNGNLGWYEEYFFKIADHASSAV